MRQRFFEAEDENEKRRKKKERKEDEENESKIGKKRGREGGRGSEMIKKETTITNQLILEFLRPLEL